MKKFVVLIAAGLLMLAFGTVYAQEKAPVLEFKASGFIDVISEYMRNVPQPGADNFSGSLGTSTNNVMFGPPPFFMRPSTTDNLAFDKRKAYMETRGRLKFDAILGKEMTGTFFFEIDSTRWGERAPGGTGFVGTTDSAVLAGDQRNYAGHWGVADRGSVEVKNLFMTFGVPFIPVPTTIQAGIHPLYIRSSAFCATEGPGITAAVKIDPAMIKLMWFKALENRDWASDDADIYAVEVNAKVQTFTIGGYVFNFNANSYPLGDQRFETPAVAVPPTWPSSLAGPSVRSDMWWYGLYADGKVGPVNINFDFVYDRGTNEDRRDIAPLADDVKFRGFGLIGNVSFPWEKFLFGISSIYGSGADMNKTSSKGYPGDKVGSGSGAIASKAGAYIIPAGTEGTAGHSLIFCGNGINRNNTGFEPALSTNHGRATFGGLWINKLYGAFQVSPDFNTRIEAMWIRDTTKNGNTIGNALTTAGLTRDDKDVGWEIDWLNTLLIYKNLSFQFGGGILFAGDAMDYAVQGAAAGTNKSPKNPYVITTNLTYSF